MNNAIWLLILPVCIGLILLVLIWRGLPTRFETTAKTESGKEPKFTLVAGPNVLDSYSVNRWGTLPVRFLHPVVSIDSGTAKNCVGHLTKIRRNAQEWTIGDQLTFSSSSKPRGELSKTLHHGATIYRLDVVVITSGGEIRICNEDREWRRWPSLGNIFAEAGDYFLDVSLVGDDIAAQTFTLKFEWTRNWQDSFLISKDQILQSHRPRTITDDQAGKIIDKLKGLKLRSSVQITTRAGAHESDPEPNEYARQVTRVLREAGVTISPASIALGTLFPAGVSIFVKDDSQNEDTAAAIIDAIRLTGVECKRRQRLPVGNGNVTEPEIHLIIGANEVTPPS
jgi:hypothetical protein